uniref:Reverse transcriptase Ty1/copia-type domain-containing protein n=1 Tax=Ananas comosus var. bracteatus TaxID=296719 RepID=A0A6V7PUI6_ANACO|nr:unnamed protein product [Ananas comosus var. bracteatus]
MVGLGTRWAGFRWVLGRDIDDLPRRSTRERHTSLHLKDFVDPSTFRALIVEQEEPCTFLEAINSIDAQHWKEAIEEEIVALHKNEAWNLVELPKSRKAIGCKWMYKIKRGTDGTIQRNRARLVAKGFAQKEGMDFFEKKRFICKLKKSLYGLKQASRQWYRKFDTFMLSRGFQRSKYDHCVYLKFFKDGTFVVLVLYVDDMLIVCKDKLKINELKDELSKAFEIKDLGPAPKAVKTPFASHFKLSSEQSPKTEEEKKLMNRVPYSSVVGSLMFAMVCTRPDIAYVVGVLSRFMANPGKVHWEAAKWVLRYLRGTSDYAIMYAKNSRPMQGYVDANFAGDLDKRRSTTGFVYEHGNGPISWMSKLQVTVALSTTEAEYMALTEATKEAVWLQGLMKELGMNFKPMCLLCDSMSAICLAKNPVYHKRTKHIDVQYHYIRDVIEDGKVRVLKVGTHENVADMLTKPVQVEKLNWSLTSLGFKLSGG